MPKQPPDPPWMGDLLKSVYDTLIPLAFGPENGPSAAIRSGTCCAVQIGSEMFLVTAAHVLTPAMHAVQMDPHTICVVGTYVMEMRGRQVYRDERLDLATIPLSRRHIESLESDGRRIVRIDQWPPRLAQCDEPVIFGGYPGSIRRIESWDAGFFNAVVSAGVVSSVSLDTNWFTYHGDPVDMTQTNVTTGVTEELLQGYRGISGGPVFRAKGKSVAELELVGIVCEGGAELGHLVRCARRLDIIEASGSISGGSHRT
jgi:Trypsin-like peptidase domain